VRLLERARLRPNDPELFAGLVQACRYTGELEASLAAHECATRLDRHCGTSIAHTWFLLGNYRKTLDCYARKGGYYLDAAALAALGSGEEAAALLRERARNRKQVGAIETMMDSLLACLEGDFAESIRAVDRVTSLTFRDPESFFYLARHLARAHESERALRLFEHAIEGGFYCAFSLVHDTWLEPLRAARGFAEVLGNAEARRRAARAAFIEAGGEQLLGRAALNGASA
jgi:tetratricopeptide (TPR) repeat protein